MTSTDYGNPYRPVPIRIFNRLARAGQRIGLSGRLDVDKFVKHAMRKTGLSDFGDDGHLEALQVLVESINDEAKGLAERYVTANPQYRFGRHHYLLEYFGLSEQVMDQAFAAYREAYAIPFE